MSEQATINVARMDYPCSPAAYEACSGTPLNAEELRVRITMEVRSLRMPGRELTSPTPFPTWMNELREMRGRIIYENGHRPFFRLPDGKFDDFDADDLRAYHIIARLEGNAVGCARILPLAVGHPTTASSVLGEDRFNEILSTMGVTRDRACEASRWLVVPECRKGLGPGIVAASWAVARWLSAKTSFVLAGTRQKQDRALTRLGARAVDGLPLLRSEIFDDDLRLLYFDVATPSPWMEKQIAELTGALKLDASQTVAGKKCGA